jgi:hypothetical protein
VSGWEIFTWVNVGILAVGSLLVFALFLRQLGTLLGGRPSQRAEAAAADQPDESPASTPR